MDEKNTNILKTTILFIFVCGIGFMTNILPTVTSNIRTLSFDSKLITILLAITPIILGYLIIIYFFSKRDYKWFNKKIFIIESVITVIFQIILLGFIL